MNLPFPKPEDFKGDPEFYLLRKKVIKQLTIYGQFNYNDYMLYKNCVYANNMYSDIKKRLTILENNNNLIIEEAKTNGWLVDDKRIYSP